MIAYFFKPVEVLNRETRSLCGPHHKFSTKACLYQDKGSPKLYKFSIAQKSIILRACELNLKLDNKNELDLMPLLTILEYPDSRLRTVARNVDRVTTSVSNFVEDLLETMYAAPGIGLAATQVNVHKRIIVIDVSAEHNEPLVFINPTIEVLGGMQTSEEGCVSVPGFFEQVERSEEISVKAWDKTGTPFELKAEGLLAVCIQHECDHLEGKLFVDYLSGLKRNRIRHRIQKRRRT